MRTPAPVAAALLLSTFLTAAARAQDAPKEPPAAAPAGEPAAAPGVAWTRDYAAAKDRAAKERRALLVYLTPDWFE